MVRANPALPLALQLPDPAITIRPVTMDDIAALRADCWHDHTEHQSLDHLRQLERFAAKKRGLGIVVVADDGQTLNGYGQVLIWTRCGEISDLMVSEACRSQGSGTALIQHLTRAGRQMDLPCVELGVAESNPRARVLYERLGFKYSYTLTLNTGAGEEPVHYLQLRFADYAIP